jgi:putative aldouronate transport system permease protein
MFLPGFVLILIFNYGPMYGLQLAFKEYRFLDGVWGSPWVGLEHFRRFFTSPVVLRVLRNTIEISLLRILFGFPAPIILALALNELKDGFFKRFVQTASYLPHFISWVIISAIVYYMLSPSLGVVNYVIKLVGADPIYFMTSKEWFRPVLIASSIWKGVGWGAIIYLAALSGVDPMLHEAAIVDGATRWQRIWHINLPAIAPVVSIVLILGMGGIMNAGFDQIFNMYNAKVFDVADIIDTYVYRVGLAQFEYSFSSAVGLFKSLVGLVMVLVVNTIARRIGEEGSALW